ncbi:MAG: hypothetical protein ACI9G5_002223, partial [Paracoccaceae bacterium]
MSQKLPTLPRPTLEHLADKKLLITGTTGFL